SWPESWNIRIPSGLAATHVPTAITVAFAPAEPSVSWIRRAMPRSPAPWNVRATSARPLFARAICTAGPPATTDVVVGADADGRGRVVAGGAAAVPPPLEQPATSATTPA